MKEFNYFDEGSGGRTMISKKTKQSRHSKEFLMILEEAAPNVAIRAITHAKPLLVFWVAPDGKVIDAGNAHFDNPPQRDKSILSSPTHKGHLRGRVALVGNTAYIVVYGDSKNHVLSTQQIRLLKLSSSNILSQLKNRGVSEQTVSAAQFIQEDGQDILF